MDASVESSDHKQRQEQQTQHQPHRHRQQQQQSPDTLQNVAENGGDHRKFIDKQLEQAQQDNASHAWDKVSVHRIPRHLKDGQETAVEPQCLSLGPYHHGKEHLRGMERHKWRCLQRMLDRTKHEIGRYLDSIKTLEEEARACYGGTISLSSDEFVLMMVLDGCFVIELLRVRAEGFQALLYPENDPIFSVAIQSVIPRDMLMLENQIPLFILNRLHGLQFGNPDLEGQVVKLVPLFFNCLMPTDNPDAVEVAADEFVIGLHCLDVFRKHLLHKPAKTHGEQSSGYNPLPVLGQHFDVFCKRYLCFDQLEAQTNRFADKGRPKLIRSVTELREAGIKFRKKDTDRFWDVSFENGTFLIPPLMIQDSTRSLFLNLIAFEQTHFGCPNDITSYVVFMDNLINSPQDVAELHYRGIIEHWLGSDAEVAELFNQLFKEVVFNIQGSHLAGLSEKVNSYYNRRWNTWRALLKHKYFSNPWSTISLVAAFVLLLLTFTQTFYSVYSYYKPRS